jgi:hypothetical protein
MLKRYKYLSAGGVLIAGPLSVLPYDHRDSPCFNMPCPPCYLKHWMIFTVPGTVFTKFYHQI